MNKSRFKRPITLLVISCSILMSFTCMAQQNPLPITFKKHAITKTFISEGVAVADVNKDGKTDIIAGAYWFEGPLWKSHELAKPDTFSVKTGYSNSFLNFDYDVNQDGWTDLIRVDFPGNAAIWHENPKGKKGFWKTHQVYSSVGNESPAFLDADGDGKPELYCADSKGRKVVWVQPPVSRKDTSWTAYTISSDTLRGTHMFTHGLGLGDINLDGRQDVLIKEGWWEAPADRKQENWTFHKANWGEDCSQMYALDVDGDGDQDVISSSAHNYGIWWHEQLKGADGKPAWKTHLIFKEFSQTHSLALTDMNGDGNPDLVTGKRYFAHNGHDPGEFSPAVLYWFEFKPGKKPVWIPHKIDDDSGSGLNVVTNDVNKDGLMDIVIANKKGVYFFEQVKKPEQSK